MGGTAKPKGRLRALHAPERALSASPLPPSPPPSCAYPPPNFIAIRPTKNWFMVKLYLVCMHFFPLRRNKNSPNQNFQSRTLVTYQLSESRSRAWEETGHRISRVIRSRPASFPHRMKGHVFSAKHPDNFLPRCIPLVVTFH